MLWTPIAFKESSLSFEYVLEYVLDSVGTLRISEADL